MVVFKRIMAMVAIAAVTFGLSACERKITRVEYAQQPLSCFECHSDQNTFLVAAQGQWEYSKHASGSTLHENDGSCKDCHTNEGFVARATGTTIPDVVVDPTAIHCFTCHAPHSEGNFGLRWTAVATLENGASYDLNAGNLCVACHHARRNVDTYITASTSLSSRWGPHYSPQGDMLIGSNGYEYSGFNYESTQHRGATTLNGGGACIECHKKTSGLDGAEGRYFVGGHSFNMAYDPGSGEIQNTFACENCHGEIDDFSDVGPGYSVQDSVDVLVADLSARLAATRLWTGSAPKSVTTTADSAGAVWNLLVATEDRSHGVHNAKYIMGLLRSSIMFLNGTLPQPTRLVRSRD